MIDSNDIIGKVFGRLTVLEYLGRGKHVYLCLCSCGNTTEVHRDRLLANRTKSCGCYQKDRVTTHGGTVRDGSRYSSTYRSWGAMKGRCLNTKDKDYPNYGGRGITICDKWINFLGFYEDMGDKPEGTTIGRIDNDGNYCKENCRWETPDQQQNNTRTNIRINEYTIAELSKITGLSYNAIELRRSRGASYEDIINTPLGERRKSSLKNFSEDIGKRNGKLVVEKIYSEVNSKGVKQTMYDCKCDCGNTKTVVRGNFTKTFSCGCLKSESAKSKKKSVGSVDFYSLDVVSDENLNKTFNRLTILEVRAGKNLSGNFTKMAKCLCDCGTEIVKNYYNVIKGHTQSCGCSKVETARVMGENKSFEISGTKFCEIGDVFGRYTVRKLFKKNNSVYSLCDVEGGGEREIRVDHLREIKK